MERVTILRAFEYDEYIVYQAKPAERVSFDKHDSIFCLDYARVASKWGIESEVLDMLMSYSLDYKLAVYVHYQETAAGRKKILMFDSKIAAAVLRKLRDTGRNQILDYPTEQEKLHMLIEAVKEKIQAWA